MTKRDVGEVLRLLGALSRGLRPRGESQLPEPLRAAFAEGSLGPRHMPPLFALAMGGPASVGELATRIDLAPRQQPVPMALARPAALVPDRDGGKPDDLRERGPARCSGARRPAHCRLDPTVLPLAIVALLAIGVRGFYRRAID